MAKFAVHRVRSVIAAIFALLLVVVLAAAGTTAMGMNIPILRDIAGFIGM